MQRFLLSLLAIILLIEEWLWDTLSLIGHYLALLLGLAKFEQWLSQCSPYQALFAISIPIILVTPLNIGALLLLAHGLILQGLILEIIAKLFGTIFIARFFKLSKNQLLTFKIIHFIYHLISKWLRWAHEKVQATYLYQKAKMIKQQAKLKLKQWLYYRE